MNQFNEKGAENQPTPDSLGEYAALLLEVQGLINAVEGTEIDKTNSEQERIFLFEIIGDHQIAIPTIAMEKLSHVDQIVVTLTQPPAIKMKNGEVHQQPTTLSVDILNRDFVYAIHRSNDGTDEDSSDMLVDTRLRAFPNTNLVRLHDPTITKPVKAILQSEYSPDFESRLTPVERVSDKDLNQLMLSLMFPGLQLNEDRDITNASLIQPDAFEIVQDSLLAASITHGSTQNYLFSTSDSEFNFRKLDGNTVSFSLKYVDEKTGSRITFDSDSSRNYTAEPTELVAEPNPHFANEGNATAPYYLVPEQYKGIYSLIQAEIETINRKANEGADESIEAAGGIGTEYTGLDDVLDAKNEDLFKKKYATGVIKTYEKQIADGIIEELDF